MTSLSSEETHSLLQEIPEVYHTQINDVLLAALAQSFARWTREPVLLIDLEGHGREAILDDVDLSRTVGWFTTIFPVLLALGDASSPGSLLKSIKEQLHNIPNRGIGYGIMRYLSSDKEIAKKMCAAPQSQVSFNYLGQFDMALVDSANFRLTGESRGSSRSNRQRRLHLIEINASISKGQLHVAWLYSTSIHRSSTIESLAQAYMESLQSLIAHCLSPEAGGYTPSDVAEFGWSQEDLDNITAKISSGL
jgi:non-ribosomal peptide synthase protein (TIGR01720 family)